LADELAPKEIMAWHFNPDKKVFLATVWMKNVPGALAGIVSVLAKEGVDLIGSTSANIRGTETSEWGFFAEAEKPEASPDWMKRMIMGAPNVVRCEVEEGQAGVVVDSLHYPL